MIKSYSIYLSIFPELGRGNIAARKGKNRVGSSAGYRYHRQTYEEGGKHTNV